MEISKQAVHQYALKEPLYENKLKTLLSEAEQLQEAHPGCGLKKCILLYLHIL